MSQLNTNPDIPVPIRRRLDRRVSTTVPRQGLSLPSPGIDQTPQAQRSIVSELFALVGQAQQAVAPTIERLKSEHQGAATRDAQAVEADLVRLIDESSPEPAEEEDAFRDRLRGLSSDMVDALIPDGSPTAYRDRYRELLNPVIQRRTAVRAKAAAQTSLASRLGNIGDGLQGVSKSEDVDSAFIRVPQVAPNMTEREVIGFVLGNAVKGIVNRAKRAEDVETLDGLQTLFDSIKSRFAKDGVPGVLFPELQGKAQDAISARRASLDDEKNKSKINNIQNLLDGLQRVGDFEGARRFTKNLHDGDIIDNTQEEKFRLDTNAAENLFFSNNKKQIADEIAVLPNDVALARVNEAQKNRFIRPTDANKLKASIQSQQGRAAAERQKNEKAHLEFAAKSRIFDKIETSLINGDALDTVITEPGVRDDLETSNITAKEFRDMARVSAFESIDRKLAKKIAIKIAAKEEVSQKEVDKVLISERLDVIGKHNLEWPEASARLHNPISRLGTDRSVPESLTGVLNPDTGQWEGGALQFYQNAIVNNPRALTKLLKTEDNIMQWGMIGALVDQFNFTPAQAIQRVHDGFATRKPGQRFDTLVQGERDSIAFTFGDDSIGIGEAEWRASVYINLHLLPRNEAINLAIKTVQGWQVKINGVKSTVLNNLPGALHDEQDLNDASDALVGKFVDEHKELQLKKKNVSLISLDGGSTFVAFDKSSKELVPAFDPVTAMDLVLSLKHGTSKQPRYIRQLATASELTNLEALFSLGGLINSVSHDGEIFVSVVRPNPLFGIDPSDAVDDVSALVGKGKAEKKREQLIREGRIPTP